MSTKLTQIWWTHNSIDRINEFRVNSKKYVINYYWESYTEKIKPKELSELSLCQKFSYENRTGE